MLATQLFVFFTIDSSNFDDALERLSHFGPFGSKLFAVSTPADTTESVLPTCYTHVTYTA